MTFAVLKLTEALITFGFYKTEDELIQVLDPMITLMDGSLDPTNEDEDALLFEYKLPKKKKNPTAFMR
jgi:hypothetical protein